MNSFYLFLAVVMVCTPAAVIVLRLFFKKSILFVTGLIWLLIQSFLVIFAYYMGLRQVNSDLFWAGPVVVILVVLAYYYLYQFITKPINGVIQSISEISHGNLNIQFIEKFLNRFDELGIIQHNALASEELASTCDILAGQSKKLKNIISFFNV